MGLLPTTGGGRGACGGGVVSDNDLLDGIQFTTEHQGGTRTVSIGEGVLTVHFYRASHGNYSEASETKHFRLTEVEQRWVEVTS